MSRRRFLRGVGACVALPLFESLRPALRAAEAAPAGNLAVTATGAPLRTAFVYFPNGAIPARWWPAGEGADFQLGRTLQPLESSKPFVQILGGLDHRTHSTDTSAGVVEERGGDVEDVFAALMHDAAEAYLGDMPHPLKHRCALGAAFREAEARLEEAIRDRFNIKANIPEIKRVDRALLATERRAFSAEVWHWTIQKRWSLFPSTLTRRWCNCVAPAVIIPRIGAARRPASAAPIARRRVPSRRVSCMSHASLRR